MGLTAYNKNCPGGITTSPEAWPQSGWDMDDPTTIFRAFKFKAYPNKLQEVKLYDWLRLTRDLYNCALQVRRDNYKRNKTTLSAYTQSLDLKTIRMEIPEYEKLPVRLLAFPLQRLDKAFQGFFRRVKAGQKAGYPRFKSAKRWDSLVWVSVVGCRLSGNRVILSRFGGLKVNAWTELPEGTDLRTITVKKEADGWYVVLGCRVPKPEPLPATGKSTGVDLGLRSLVAFSDGTLIPKPKWTKEAEKKIAKQQRIVARRKKGSHRRRKAVQTLAKTHQHVARKRKHFLDCLSKKIVKENDVIVTEKLNVRGLSRSRGNNAQGRGFRRSVLDAAWGQLLWMLSYKASEAGREFIQVDPCGTSQECPECGKTAKKTLNERIHCCPCGYAANRDVAAARVILERGQRALEVLRGGLGRSAPPVKREVMVTEAYAS